MKYMTFWVSFIFVCVSLLFDFQIQNIDLGTDIAASGGFTSVGGIGNVSYSRINSVYIWISGILGFLIAFGFFYSVLAWFKRDEKYIADNPDVSSLCTKNKSKVFFFNVAIWALLLTFVVSPSNFSEFITNYLMIFFISFIVGGIATLTIISIASIIELISGLLFHNKIRIDFVKIMIAANLLVSISLNLIYLDAKPTVWKNKQKACYSNLRVLQGAVEFYNMDNKEMMRYLDIDKLEKLGYLKSGGIKCPEYRLNKYKTIGHLDKDGEICCGDDPIGSNGDDNIKYHGSLSGKPISEYKR